MTSHAKKFSKLKRKSYGHAKLQYFCEQLDENGEFSLEDMHQMMDHALSYFLDLESFCIEAEIQRLEMIKQKVSEWTVQHNSSQKSIFDVNARELKTVEHLVLQTGISMSEVDRLELSSVLHNIESHSSFYEENHQVQSKIFEQKLDEMLESLTKQIKSGDI